MSVSRPQVNALFAKFWKLKTRICYGGCHRCRRRSRLHFSVLSFSICFFFLCNFSSSVRSPPHSFTLFKVGRLFFVVRKFDYRNGFFFSLSLSLAGNMHEAWYPFNWIACAKKIKSENEQKVHKRRIVRPRINSFHNIATEFAVKNPTSTINSNHSASCSPYRASGGVGSRRTL